MGAAMESYGDFLFGNRDVGWHVDEIAEDLPCLSIFIAAHAAGHEAIEPRCEHEQSRGSEEFRQVVMTKGVA
jgi:hypothetical protein